VGDWRKEVGRRAYKVFLKDIVLRSFCDRVLSLFCRLGL
jgi:hypothetical protein